MLAASIALAACSSGATDAATGSQADSVGGWSFHATLDKSFLRSTNDYLSEDAFEGKWGASRKSAMKFMRAFPGAFHADLYDSSVPVIGPMGLCFGDAHPDNFGFLLVEGQTVFAYNDLDDSGNCPIAVDAARYFAILQNYFSDWGLTKDAIKHYGHTVKNPEWATYIKSDAYPDWTKVHDKKLAKLTDPANPSRFQIGSEGDEGEDGLRAPTEAERAAITQLTLSEPRLAAYSLEDIAGVDRSSGGSGGLRRFLLLVTKAGRQDVLELKEAVRPGTELGRHTEVLPPETRPETLKSAFWGSNDAGDYYYVELEGSRFLVRNALAKKKLDVATKDGEPHKNRIMAQVSYMALRHRPYWSDIVDDESRDRLEDWLKTAAWNLAARWDDAFQAAR